MSFPSILAHLVRPRDPHVARSFISFIKKRRIMSRGMVKIAAARRYKLASGALSSSPPLGTGDKNTANLPIVEIRGAIATKDIPAEENIIICPIEECFSLASVLKDKTFIEHAFGYQLESTKTHPLRKPGICSLTGTSGNPITGSMFKHLLVPDQVSADEIKKTHLSFHLQCPVRSRVGNSVVRESQLLMALYMVTQLLEALRMELNSISEGIIPAGPIGSSSTSNIFPDESFINYFRFLPNPLTDPTCDGADFSDFYNIMSAGLMNNTPAAQECVNYLMERFANCVMPKLPSEAYTTGEGLSAPPKDILRSEQDAQFLLIWALSMIFSRSTVINHSSTLIKAFEGVHFPSTTTQADGQSAASLLFAPEIHEVGLADPNQDPCSVPRDRVLPVMAPLIDLCNHTDDPKHENVAVYIPTQKQHTSRVITVRSLRAIKKGEELCMRYDVAPRELSVFYGIKGA